MAQQKPLIGVKVIERAGRLAGSVCANRLQDLGADVCRIVVTGDILPNEPESWRDHPFTSNSEVQVELNSLSPDFPRNWEEMVSQADIVIVTPAIDGNGKAQPVATMCGSTMESKIICAMSPFGLKADDVPVINPSEVEMQAICGLLAVTGDTNDKPAIVDIPVLEIFTGINTATSALAALRFKKATGKGQILDMSVFEASFTLTGTFLGNIMAGKARGFRNGCRHPLVAPWNAYQTSDGWVILCTTNNQNWEDLTGVIAQRSLADDPRFATAQLRISNVQEIDAVISEWAQTKSTKEALAGLQGRGIPSSTIAEATSIAKLKKPTPCLRNEASLEVFPEKSGNNKPPEALNLPCEGIRVLELGPYTAGPLAGRFLANLGAEVIKIEPIGGEDSRLWQPVKNGVSSYFANYNAGKRSVVLDLRTQNGKAVFLDLVKSSDVLLFNLKAGAMERLGLGAADLHKINPKLIYCGISGYGFNGSKRPALDTVIQAEAGFISRIKSETGPIKAGFSIADLAAAHTAPMEILAGLHHVQQTGRGMTLDISMFDIVAWITELSWPHGHRVLPPNSILQTSDGWIVTSCEACDLEAEIDSESTRNFTSSELIEKLHTAGLSALNILELDQVYDLAVTRQLNLLHYENGDKSGNCIISAPYSFSRTPTRNACTVPAAGADNVALIGVLYEN